MSELLNSGKVGLTNFRNLAEQRKQVVSMWEEGPRRGGRRHGQGPGHSPQKERRARRQEGRPHLRRRDHSSLCSLKRHRGQHGGAQLRDRLRGQ